MYLFVYGTLKKGYTNHYLLSRAGARFIGDAWVEGYTILDQFVPVAVPAPRKCRVYGELYEVDQDTIKILDVFEEGYERVETTAVTISSIENYRAYIYIVSSPTSRCYYSYYTQ